MSSCVRIDPKDFHGAEANAYTQRALEDLARSKQFRSYMSHIDYKERLHLTWFLIPLGLVAVFYYHLAVFNPDFMLPLNNITTSVLETRAASAPGLPYITILVLLFLLPCTLVAPFAGFFEEPSVGQSMRLLMLFTLVNVALVSYGGTVAHHPPLLTTTPGIPWKSIIMGDEEGSQGLDAWAALRVLAVRVIPLQGLILAGYTVSQWQRAFWRRVWHLPFPLLSIPFLVGTAGLIFWRASSLALPYFFSATGEATSAATYSWDSARSDPHGVLSLWRSIAEEVGGAMVQEARDWVAGGGGVPSVLSDPTSCVHLYLAGMSLALAYFATLAARPFLEFLMDGLCVALPVDPTIWGLTLLSALGGLAMLLRMDELMLPYVAALSCLVFLLLFNGFVA